LSQIVVAHHVRVGSQERGEDIDYDLPPTACADRRFGAGQPLVPAPASVERQAEECGQQSIWRAALDKPGEGCQPSRGMIPGPNPVERPDGGRKWLECVALGQ